MTSSSICLLMLPATAISFISTTTAAASTGSNRVDISSNGRGDREQEQEWKTYYLVGKFLYNKPPKPDQLFKIYYRVINGSVDSFSALAPRALPGNETVGLFLVANVSSTSNTGVNGLFEIKFPRNFPYLNGPYSNVIVFGATTFHPFEATVQHPGEPIK